MKTLKNLLIIISVIVIGGIATIGVIKLPSLIQERQVNKASLASDYNTERFQGWVLAYNALKRENNVLYSDAPTNKKDFAQYEALGYPNKWFPDLIEDYGIAVQKSYSGKYIYDNQKLNLTSFLNGEANILSTAGNSWMNKTDKMEADDAQVVQALQSYTILVGKLQSSTNQITLENSKKTSIGSVLNKEITEEEYYKPLVWGQVAMNYLDKNIKAQQGSYEATIKDSNFVDKNPEITKQVNAYLGIK